MSFVNFHNSSHEPLQGFNGNLINLFKSKSFFFIWLEFQNRRQRIKVLSKSSGKYDHLNMQSLKYTFKHILSE